MSIPYAISVVGYKANDSELGYEEKNFKVVLSLTEQQVKSLESGNPLPSDILPKLPKGYVDSPKLITKQDRYEFKPNNDLGGLKVISKED